jgi:glycosyltransferase involved in cell wall biosynthesis
MITFIVPAFNEEGNVAPTVETIRLAAKASDLDCIEIVVVDDGSTDATPRELAYLSSTHSDIRVITNGMNLGLGASVRAGIDVASMPAFMVVPGDNDVSIEMMIMMLKFRSEADMILTAILNKEQRSLTRNLISMLYQAIYMTFFRVHVTYINGPGVWPTDAARRARLTSRRFSVISEMNVKLLRMGCSFAEVPGYVEAGPKGRSTITMRNLSEVVASFCRLLIEVHWRRRDEFRSRPVRKKINFLDRFG